MAAGRQRLDSIQAMRAVAALAVVAFHSGREVAEKTGTMTPTLRFLDICDFGVDIFFVISGFIMYYVTFGRPTGWGEAKSFLLKRLIRVGPMYWIFTTLFVIPVLFAPSLLNRSGISLPYTIASYLFFPWQRPAYEVPSVSPIFGLGWTLNYEVTFYLVFAVLIAFGVRRKLLWSAIVFGLLALAGPFAPGDNAQAYFWTRSIMLEFVGGVAIAALFCRETRFGTGAGLALMLAGVIVWIMGGYGVDIHSTMLNVRGIVWGAAATAVMAGVALTPPIGRVLAGRENGVMALLGNASFSLYLSHLFVVRIMSIILGKLGLLGNPLLLVAANMVAASIAAILVYRFLEKPLTRIATNLVFDPAKRPAILPGDQPAAASQDASSR